MNKLTLKYELDLDFVLIAVTVSLKDYRLCYKINKQLGVEFYREDELILQLRPNEQHMFFNKFHYQIPDSETDFYLLSNKGTEGFLIPEMKQADYFILIKNYIDDEDLEYFITGINRIPEVLVAAEVDPKKLKSKENLIF